MAQYDLLLTQNVAAAGEEFSEKYVNLAKGALLSAITGGTPTVLAAGTNGYMLVRDDAEATGLKWVVIAAGHTQNTDTGTTSNTFEISSDGVAGSILIDGAQAGGDFETKVVNQTQVGNIILTLPAVTGTLATEAYAAGLFAANDAMIFKGTIGAGGTHTIAAFNALTTYNAGWTYRVTEAGTIRGVVCEIGDLVMVIVDRTGSGNMDADFTVGQTNLDGAVTGPASVTVDGNIALFNGTTGKIIKDSTVLLSTLATTTNLSDYIAKALLDANTIIAANADNTPLALTVGEQTFVGRVTSGNIAALTAAQAMSVLWQTAPATKTSTGTAGWIARDANFFYVCTATDTWKRSAIATNW